MDGFHKSKERPPACLPFGFPAMLGWAGGVWTRFAQTGTPRNPSSSCASRQAWTGFLRSTPNIKSKNGSCIVGANSFAQVLSEWIRTYKNQNHHGCTIQLWPPFPLSSFFYPLWVVGHRANSAPTSNAQRHKRGQKVETGGLMPDSNNKRGIIFTYYFSGIVTTFFPF